MDGISNVRFSGLRSWGRRWNELWKKEQWGAIRVGMRVEHNWGVFSWKGSTLEGTRICDGDARL